MENEMETIPEMEDENEGVRLPAVAVDTHLDFKLEGWPAAAVFMTLFASCVMLYGITVWGKTRSVPAPSVAS